jgi:hypothetical protein
MTKSIPSLLAILITSLAFVIQVTTNAKLARPSVKDFRSHWLSDSNHDRNELLKKWHENKRIGILSETNPASSPFDILQSNHQFKGLHFKYKNLFKNLVKFSFCLGCIDPSEPFQCPQSERCIALQFICDGHPGDCPGNVDENEETCIAGI